MRPTHREQRLLTVLAHELAATDPTLARVLTDTASSAARRTNTIIAGCLLTSVLTTAIPHPLTQAIAVSTAPIGAFTLLRRSHHTDPTHGNHPDPASRHR